MKIIKHSLAILVITIIASGCNAPKVSWKTLQDRFDAHQAETVNAILYMGSDKNDHYLHHAFLTMYDTSYYRIDRSELTIPNEFPVTQDKTKWRKLEMPIRFDMSRMTNITIIKSEPINAPYSLPAQDEAGIIAKYSGRYSTLAIDDQGKEIRIAGHKVIRSQEDYVAFVSGIPKLEIAMTKGFSGKSDDPLLAMPKINFSNQMMVAVIRDGSMYQPPDIESVVATNGTLTVNYSQRSLEEVAGLQEAGGIGTYVAAVVKKAERKVEFQKRDIPSQPPSANGDGNPAPAGASVEKCPIHKVAFSKGPGQLPEGMTVSWTKEVYDAMEKYPYVRRNTWNTSIVKYCRSCEEEVENAGKSEKKAYQKIK